MDKAAQTSAEQKLLCVGLNKTGTTSIGDALEILGYRRLGWKPAISGVLTVRWHEGNLKPFMPHLMNNDAFEDLPWCLVYEAVDRMFPNSKFILTTRRDEQTWLRSMQRHLGRTGNWVGSFLVYGSYDPAKDADTYLRKYREHRDAVRRYFAGRPGKLLEMCFEDGDGWEKLCTFLNVPKIPDVPFPHANRDQKVHA
jgi:hypothetical protein